MFVNLRVVDGSKSVALRKESVDRNVLMLNCMIGPPLSLSARRAWIEIMVKLLAHNRVLVALRKESVDRNVKRLSEMGVEVGRSPQGERG